MTTTSEPRVLIRAIGPDDQAAIERFYAELSVDSRAARFLGTTSLGTGTAARFCHADHRHRQGLVAEVVGAAGGRRIVGHACLEPATAGEIEFAVAVADDWHHRGVGRALLDGAIRWARRRGVTHLVASTRSSNVALLGLLRSSGHAVRLGAEDAGVVDVIVDLAEGLPSAA
jgi:GNAT superfamily N-acetyltransferase